MSLKPPIVDPKSNILFVDRGDGSYEPLAVDYDIEKKTGRLIKDDPMLMEIMEFCYYFQRKKNNKGKYISLPIFPYQWSFIFTNCMAIANADGESNLYAMSRQAGKSFSIKLTKAIACTILPEYMEIKHDRFFTILGSYKKESVVKLFKECKTAIYKAVEFYNKRHTSKLIMKNGDYKNNKLVDSDERIEINKRFADDEEVGYSACIALTIGASQDGLSSHFTTIDESGLCDYETYEVSIAPFSASTNGATLFVGVPNQNSASLISRKYSDDVTRNHIYDVRDIYDLRKLSDPEWADMYWKHYKNEEKKHGKNASFIQWNYWMSMDCGDGRFCTRDILEKNNIMTELMRYPQYFPHSRTHYTVAGFDISAKHDYKSMIIGESVKNDDDYVNKVSDMITFNKKGIRNSFEQVAKMCIENCIKYKIDILCFDATNQGGHAMSQLLHKYKKEYNCNTMIVMFSYNQSTKVRLFSYLESNMYGGNLKILQENQSWESKKLVEEMLYMIKEQPKKGATGAKYYAPEGGGDFTDDHVNALALFNIALKECYERKGKKFDDGSNLWRCNPTKFRTGDHVFDKRTTSSLTQYINIV